MSFRTMDDLIRFLEILPPGHVYRLKSDLYGEIAPWDSIRILRQVSIVYVDKRTLKFIPLFCTPLYGGA